MPNHNATVLIVELPGFAEISVKMEGRELQSLLSTLEELADSTVRHHQGNVANFAGDSFTVVFSGPKSGASTGMLAMEACQDFRERLELLAEEKGLSKTMGFKAGISGAEAIVTGINDQDNARVTVMGPAVTFASRLKDFAQNNQVLADSNVFEEARERFDFIHLEPLPVRGSKEQLEVYELRGKKQAKLKLDVASERKIASEMIGRGREMKQLESLFKQLLAGKGWIVSIVGKAGMGKSRLMAEMKAQPMMDKVLLLEGRAVSTGQNLSFHPITNLIKSWAGITEDDLPSVASEKLFQGIKRITEEQADEIYAFLATMMGLPLKGKYKERVKGIEGEALEKLILKNLRDLIIAATKDKPRIYMIEDMHWADSSSITLIESLYKLSQNYPVMFINVMRPGYKDTGDYILKFLEDKFPGSHTTININPLEEKESGNLIKNLLRETKLPEDIHKMIIRKTEGNPFFIEEIIRSFIDEGIIEVRDNGLRVTGKINDVNIPDTINEVILSRVDKLDEKTRELLNTASVMGRNFYYKILEETTDTIEELDERLAYLTEVQLITESKKKEEIEYLFKHALAQQLTYDAMMLQSRREIHLKIARSIEKVFRANINEFYGTLVYHYELAEDMEKAIYFMLLAGEEAMRSGASSEALRFFERALDTLPQSRKNDPQDNETRDLRINIAKMYHAVGRNFESVELFEYVFEKYFNYRVAKTERGIMLRGIRGMVRITFAFKFPMLFFKKSIKKEDELICTHFDDWAAPMALINPRHFVFKPSDAIGRFLKYDFMNSPAILESFIQIATVFLWVSFSYPTARRLIDLVDQAGFKLNPRTLAALFMAKSMFDLNTGNRHYNIGVNEVINTGIKAGELFMTSITAMNIGMQKIDLGDYARPIEISDKLIELGNSFENSYAIAQGYRVRSVCLMKFRRFEHLQELLDEARVFMCNTNNKLHLFALNLVQCHLNIYNDDLEAAVKSFKEVNESRETIKSIGSYNTPYLITKIHLGLALMSDNRNKGIKNNKEIGELLKTSRILISKSKKYVSNLTEAYLLRSRIFMFQQKSGKAFKNLQLAIATGEKYQNRLELSRVCFETGKFLSNPNNRYKELNGQPASYFLEKAKTMFEEMGLEWDLDQWRRLFE